MQVLRDELLNNTSQFEKITSNLDGLMTQSSTIFKDMKDHQEEYLSALDENVSDLSKQVAESLKDYAEQANGQTANHLQLWAQHTSSYSEKMNVLVGAIQNVVDEIETKSSGLA